MSMFLNLKKTLIKNKPKIDKVVNKIKLKKKIKKRLLDAIVYNYCGNNIGYCNIASINKF